jgi:hypothetical protein
VPRNSAEIADQARWLTQGGAVPAGASYAPGFVAVVDPAGGEPVFWRFREHRPLAAVADGADLWLLTEGTPGRMFDDGVLARIAATGEWSVVAQGLAMPNHLKATERRVCWTEMPTARFAVRCLERSSGALQTLVDQDWNVLDFAFQQDALYWSTLTQGLRRAEVP